MTQTPTKAGTAPQCCTIIIRGQRSPHRLVIAGRLPGLNEYTNACRTNAQAGHQMKINAQELVQWAIIQQMRQVKFKKPVFMLYTFIEKDRRRDRDNVSSFARKVIQDALVRCGTLQDDGWDHITGSLDQYEVDKENPRIIVEFIEQEEADTKCKKLRDKSSKK